MEYLKLTKGNLVKMLGAVSYQFEMDFKKKELDPEHFRKLFYNIYHRDVNEVETSIVSDVEFPECDGEMMMFDTDTSGGYTQDCGSCGREWDIYLLFWEKDGTFFTCIVKKVQYTHMGMSLGGYDEDNHHWEMECEKNANFIDLTVEYHKIVKQICEKFGYGKIIKYIKKNC